MAFRHPALDLTVAVKTPENISFEYQIAGPFRRLPAMLIDIAVRWLVVFFVAIIFAFSGIYMYLPSSGTLFMVAMNLLIFLFSWFYGLLFEVWWNGQTPGKHALNLRVVSIDGRPINAAQATIRNIVRVADFFPLVSIGAMFGESDLIFMPTFLVSLVCMLSTTRFQRLGDLAAGTMVVVDERGWIATKIAVGDPRVPSLAEFIPSGFRMSRSMAKTIALYMERRLQMSPARQQQVATILAGPLLNRFGFRSDTSADLLLCALYYREFLHDPNEVQSRRISSLGSPLIADGYDSTDSRESAEETSPVAEVAGLLTEVES